MQRPPPTHPQRSSSHRHPRQLRQPAHLHPRSRQLPRASASSKVRKTLFEVLSSRRRPPPGRRLSHQKSPAASSYGPIPLPQAQTDPATETSIATVNLNDIINATDPAENILILPGDAISVPRAELVYVIGSVSRAGGFALNEHSTISALQVLSLAEGLSKTAASDHARILRKDPSFRHAVEIAVNLKSLLDGKIPDVPLSNDILFVPNSDGQIARARTAESSRERPAQPSGTFNETRYLALLIA